MKKSRFVTVIEKQSGDILVHSGLEGAVLNIEKNKIPEFNLLCNGNIPKNDSPFINLAWEKVIGAFKQAKILIDDEFDELRFLEYMYEQRRFHNRSDIEVSISPTMKCNLACPYCYNPSTRTSMPQKTKDEIINFVKDGILSRMPRLSALRPQKLCVFWIGGEPLLDFKLFSKLAEGVFRATCEENYPFESRLITNGTLLTKEIATQIAREPYCVNTVQITLDGHKNMHDQRRVFRDGRPSYEIICDNIKSAKKYIRNVVVRIGAAPDFELDDMRILIEELRQRNVVEESDKNISFIMSMIVPCGKEFPVKDLAIPYRKFAVLELEVAKLARKLAFPFRLSLPARPQIPCSFLRDRSFAIDSKGRISKCFECMGREEGTIGRVTQALTPYEGEFYKWNAYSPFSNDNCRRCSYLPMCMGGCPFRAMNNGKQPCPPHKFNFRDRLLFEYCRE